MPSKPHLYISTTGVIGFTKKISRYFSGTADSGKMTGVTLFVK